MSKYSELLKHPYWQKKRLEIMQRDNFCCSCCKSTVITLNVHHKEYINGLNPWEYSDDLLITLCEICHAKEHNLIQDDLALEVKTISDVWYDVAIQNLYIMERLKFRWFKYGNKKAVNKMFKLLINEAHYIQTILFNTPKYL